MDTYGVNLRDTPARRKGLRRWKHKRRKHHWQDVFQVARPRTEQQALADMASLLDTIKTGERR